MSLFEELYTIDVSDKIEKKSNLNYLSWAWAWAELKKRCPDASYEIRMWDGKPYLEDENLGYLCMVSVTVEGETHEMWLPVMDSANNAMKSKPYTIKSKYGEKEIAQATMFDVNKTIMRCLVKCIGMFGLGLYIYGGEDLPETPKLTDTTKKAALDAKLKANKVTQKELLALIEVSAMDKLTVEDFQFAMTMLDNYERKDEYFMGLCKSSEVDPMVVLGIMKRDSVDAISLRDVKNLMDINVWQIVRQKATAKKTDESALKE